MSYPRSDSLDDELADHQLQLIEALPNMSLLQWKALKGILYSTLLVLATVAISITHGSWMQLLVLATAVLIIFGVELEEVQVANLFTVTFDTSTDTETECDTDGDES